MRALKNRFIRERKAGERRVPRSRLYVVFMS